MTRVIFPAFPMNNCVSIIYPANRLLSALIRECRAAGSWMKCRDCFDPSSRWGTVAFLVSWFDREANLVDESEDFMFAHMTSPSLSLSLSPFLSSSLIVIITQVISRKHWFDYISSRESSSRMWRPIQIRYDSQILYMF